jgi:cobalt-precorrin 5A hydrolase
LKLGIISVTTVGDKLAEKIRSRFEAEVYLSSQIQSIGIVETTGRLFKNCCGIIFIASTGIVVRAIASFIVDKTKDPAVVVIDSTGRFVISLLSGHIGGANELAKSIAEFISAVPVITTATDNLGIKAPDSFAVENGLIIESMDKAKLISSMLVEGKKVAFIDVNSPRRCAQKMEVPRGYTQVMDEAEAVVMVTDSDELVTKGFEDKPVLRLIKKDIVIGIGCRKGFSPPVMLDCVYEKLKEFHIDKRAVKIVATAEIKREEEAVVNTARELEAELKVFSINHIKKVQEKFEGSSFVEKAVGVRAVCEPCVELCGAEILSGKIKCDGMTICIGKIKN